MGSQRPSRATAGKNCFLAKVPGVLVSLQADREPSRPFSEVLVLCPSDTRTVALVWPFWKCDLRRIRQLTDDLLDPSDLTVGKTHFDSPGVEG